MLPACATERLRIAFFHTELSRDGPGILLADILSGEDPQVLAVADVVRAVGPDILVLAGVDWDLERHALNALADVIGSYPHRFAARPNRGIDSGLDLNGDGRTGGPDDAFGFAEFAGQDGMAVLSALPFDLDGWREFTDLDWTDLPGALLLPADGAGGHGRLSTTVHWDLPVILPDGSRLSLLAWHATPPVFDGPSDRNGRRNHDEAAFWLQYLDHVFGPAPGQFVLLGAANLDPLDGDGRPDALEALLAHPGISDPRPASAGAVAAARADGGANLRHRADPEFDTVDWPDGPGRPGNLRVDYVLPAASLGVLDAGVFWPAPGAPAVDEATLASRHRLVWVDLAIGPE